MLPESTSRYCRRVHFVVGLNRTEPNVFEVNVVDHVCATVCEGQEYRNSIARIIVSRGQGIPRKVVKRSTPPKGRYRGAAVQAQPRQASG